MMSDATLIQAHRAGDPCAISTLMERYKSALMGMLVNRVGPDAEDLYQETWIRVSRNIGTYNEQGSFKAWLFQIARRLVIDHHRRQTARIRLVYGETIAEPNASSSNRPDQNIRAAEVHAVFATALTDLDAATAEVVRMRIVDNTPFKIIADHQGVPINTALGRMHRGLKRIREALIAAELIETTRTP